MEEHDTIAREAPASDGGAGAPPDPESANRAPDLTREYVADGVTVQWYATRCIHSANCVRSLPRVFDPKRRPWVEPSFATPDEIAHAVLRCPTGALHFVRHDGGAQEVPDVPTTVTSMSFGPQYLRGDVTVRDTDESVLRHDTRIALCRCGKAQRAPFCDNSCRAGPDQRGGQ